MAEFTPRKRPRRPRYGADRRNQAEPDTLSPRSDAEIERLAREAFAAAPPRSPDDWGGVTIYLRSVSIGRDHNRVLTWAQRNLRIVAQPGDGRARGAYAQADYSAVTLTLPGYQGYLCRYCGNPAAALDHVWPRARGGDDHPNNLVPACLSCNSTKGTRSILTDACPDCGAGRDPSDVVTATGEAFYSCRCGASWHTAWDLQHVPLG